MNMEARMTSEPCFDRGGFVSVIVVLMRDDWKAQLHPLTRCSSVRKRGNSPYARRTQPTYCCMKLTIALDW